MSAARAGRLQGKRVLVVGASSGIGAAVARRCAAEGARVVAAGLPQPPADTGASLALACDVRDATAVDTLLARTLAQLGGLDGLVNCAGVVASDDAADIEDALWQNMLDINLGGTMRVMRAALPAMLGQGGGSVVNVASVAAFNASAGMASYAASKAGVVALSRSAASAYGAQGIRVNALCPGWVHSPMSEREMQELAAARGITPEAAHAQTVSRVALGRMARPEEIAAVAVFLLSDEASFVTGAALVADGGMRVPAASRAV